jgi:hypothetical protein
MIATNIPASQDRQRHIASPAVLTYAERRLVTRYHVSPEMARVVAALVFKSGACQ